MEKNADNGRMGPLAGTERAFFEGQLEGLRTLYEADVQRRTDVWEASSGKVAVLGWKRFRNVYLPVARPFLSRTRVQEAMAQRYFDAVVPGTPTYS